MCHDTEGEAGGGEETGLEKEKLKTETARVSLRVSSRLGYQLVCRPGPKRIREEPWPEVMLPLSLFDLKSTLRQQP